MNNYLKIAFSYGFIRKYWYTKDLKYREIKDNQIIEKPILYIDYLFNSLYSGIYSCFVFPIYIYNDIRILELKIRNIKINDPLINKNIITNYDITTNNHIYEEY